MVQKWFTEFRCGGTSTEIIPNPGRPNEITTPEMINKIHDIVLNDPEVKVREIESISTSIWKSFRVDLWRWMKHQSTATRRKVNLNGYSQNRNSFAQREKAVALSV